MTHTKRNGYGKHLVNAVEQDLLSRHTEQIYLTSDSAVSFWDICGYSDEGADLEGMHTLTKVMGKKSNNN